MLSMKDYIVRATAANGQVRAFAAITRETVEEARQHHGTSPVATAALGRLLTAGTMMGSMMKNETDMLTLQVRGDGPIGGITVTADSKGDVKGYVENPDVMLPPKNGKLDVGGAVGIGLLQVIKDMGLKEPYSGQTILVSSEIAEDLTYYFANSEQVPSSVGLGVLMEKDNTVKTAGGFIIQMMPFAEDATISQIEENLKLVTSVTELLDKGYTPEQLLEELLGNVGLEITDTMPTRFYCNCSKSNPFPTLWNVKRNFIIGNLCQWFSLFDFAFLNQPFLFRLNLLIQFLSSAFFGSLFNKFPLDSIL